MHHHAMLSHMPPNDKRKAFVLSSKILFRTKERNTNVVVSFPDIAKK